jgi:prolyl-tRNA synthetase
MGSYGIGITRLLATLAEVYNDENGLKLPIQVAPFPVYLIDLTDGQMAARLEEELRQAGVEALVDDRAVSAGEKFADADLIGLPYRVVYSQKTAESGSVEVKNRQSGQTELVKLSDLVEFVSKKTLD